MPGLLLNLMTGMTCQHAMKATIAPSQPRVLVNNSPIATMASQIVVTGLCPFAVGPKPQPCVLIKWAMPSTRFLVDGKPAMLAPPPGPGPGPGICQSAEQIPQGAPIIAVIQPRVMGS